MLIGSVGKAGAGKDFCADIFEELLKERGEELVKVSLADQIRKFIEAVNPLVVADMGPTIVSINHLLCLYSWDELKNCKVNPEHFDPEFCSSGVRKLMQDYGESARKLWGISFWVDKILPSEQQINKAHFYGMHNWWGIYSSFLKYPNNYYVRDVRRIYEANRIKALGGYIIRITDPQLEESEEWRNHETEQEIDKIEADFEVVNDKSLHSGNISQQMCAILERL